MGIFGSIFGKPQDGQDKKKIEVNSAIQWIPLTSISQFDEIKEKSRLKTVGIFKHSTRCIISKTVLKNFEENFLENFSEHFEMYYLDLLNYREVSNEVGHEFEVLHQSPQLLLIQNEVTVTDASHYDITQLNLKKFIH